MGLVVCVRRESPTHGTSLEIPDLLMLLVLAMQVSPKLTNLTNI